VSISQKRVEYVAEEPAMGAKNNQGYRSSAQQCRDEATVEPTCSIPAGAYAQSEYVNHVTALATVALRKHARARGCRKTTGPSAPARFRQYPPDASPTRHTLSGYRPPTP